MGKKALDKTYAKMRELHAGSFLCFETEEDADRFARELKAQSGVAAQPLPWDTAKIREFCRDYTNQQVAFVPSGGSIAPPKYFEIIAALGGLRYDYDVEELDPSNKIRPRANFHTNETLIA